MSVEIAANEVCSECRKSTLLDKYPRWRGSNGSFISQKEFEKMDNKLGFPQGTVEESVRQHGLRLAAERDAIDWPKELMDKVVLEEELYKNSQGLRREVYSLATGRELVGSDIIEIMRDREIGGDSLLFKERLWQECPTKGEATRAKTKAENSGKVKARMDKQALLEAELLAVAKDYLRRRIESGATIFYIVVPSIHGGRIVRNVRAMTLQDHKGMHLLFQDIYDCPDVRPDVRQKVRKAYDDFNKSIEEALIESGKMMRDPAYREAARVLLQNIAEIPLIENEIPLISWEDARSQNPPLAHHVLDRSRLEQAQASIVTYDSFDNIETYLSNYCPTWKRWMDWNGHKVGNYDSVGCFFMWLWKLCGTDYSKTMREIFYLVGPGRTGNTSVANAIEAFLKPISCTVDPDAGEFANASYIDKRFGVIPENKKTRSSGSAIIKSLSGGDVLKINQKHQAAYTARVHLVMLSLNNENPMINLYDNSEYSRTYVLHTRRPVDKGQPEAAANSETIVAQYHHEMYPLLAYCKYLFQKHFAMNADLILRKPEDMERIIVNYCLTQGSGYLKKYEAYAEAVEKSKSRWIQMDEFITHVMKYNTESEDLKIRKEVLAAIKSGVLSKRLRLHHVPAGNGDLYIFAPPSSKKLYKSFDNEGKDPDVMVSGQVPFDFDL
jgi:hypothetical protein